MTKAFCNIFPGHYVSARVSKNRTLGYNFGNFVHVMKIFQLTATKLLH